MKTKAILGVLALAGLTMTGCATVYQPMGLTGGYWDRRLASNLFQVGFRGNGFTSPEDAFAYALRHSAEVTNEAGFRYFVMLDENQASSDYQIQTQGSYQSYTDGYGYTSGTYTPGDTFDIHKPRTVFLIKCFNENPGEHGFDAYDILGIGTNGSAEQNSPSSLSSSIFDSSPVLRIDHAQP